MLDYLCNGLRIFFHYMKSPDISPQLIRGICGRCRNAGIVQRASIGNCITYPKNIFGLFFEYTANRSFIQHLVVLCQLLTTNELC